MNKNQIQEIDFDFGFTAVDEEELETVQQYTAKVEVASTEVEQLKDKLVMLRKAIEPLLKNLEQNPEKQYIHWPDRTAKVKAFRSKLDQIQKL